MIESDHFNKLLTDIYSNQDSKIWLAQTMIKPISHRFNQTIKHFILEEKRKYIICA